jgi:hypothetical protein
MSQQVYQAGPPPFKFLARLYAQRWRLIFLLLVTLLVAFIIQEGFEHAQVGQFRDQSVQLPILYSYADHNLFPGDLLLEARVTYVTWLYPVLGFLSRYIPLELLMLALYVSSVGLTISAVYYLAEHFFPGQYAGLIAVLLWTVWLPNPGGDFLRSSFPTHTTTAVGLQLWGLVLALRGRSLWAAALIGFAININAMTGLFLGLTWAFWLLSQREQWSWRLLLIPLVAGLFALPTLYWKFGSGAAVQDIPMEDFVGIMRTRLWYAIFPFSVNSGLWLSFGMVLAAWFYAARYAPNRTNVQVFCMMQAIVLLVIVGTVFTEFYPVELVIELQLLRSTWVLNLFAMLYFANMIAHLLKGNRAEMYLAIGLTILMAAPRVILEFVPLPQPTPYLAYVDLNPVQNPSPTWWGMLGLCVLLGGIALAAWRMLPHQGDLHLDRRMAAWLMFAGFLFALPLFIDTSIPDEQALTTREWAASLEWVRENTPVDAQFVTPPTMDGFRVGAQRTHFSDWKDGTLLVFNPELAQIWLTRMQELGFDEQSFRFETPTQAQLCHIIQKYEMDYILADLQWGIQGEAVYQNKRFSVIPAEKLVCGRPSS